MFSPYDLLLKLKTKFRIMQARSAASRLRAKTRWVPSEADIQRGREVLLRDYEHVHNLPLQDFAHLAQKSLQQILDEIQKGQLLALNVGSRGLKIPDWQLDPVKLLLTQSVLKSASDVDSWTLYNSLSLPLEGLDGISPVDAVAADSVDRVTDHVLSLLGIH